MLEADVGDGLSISAVSTLLGIPVPTIRSWERRYAFPAPSRTSGSHRRYAIEEIDQLRTLRDEVATGRRAGDAVDEIRRRAALTRDGTARWVEALLEASMRMDSAGIARTIAESTGDVGVDRTIELLLLPVMREIGTRWEAGKCDVANEHFASQEIRRWLSGQLLAVATEPKLRSAVLACGPEDLHTIGLEGFYVILTRRGWNCRYLGERTPASSLVRAIETVRPDAVIIASHMGTNRRATIASIRSAAEVAGDRIFYGGRAFISARSRRGLPGTYLGEDMVAAAEMLGDGTRAA